MENGNIRQVQNRNKTIDAVWRQALIPAIYRPPTKGKVLIKLPYSKGNWSWLSHNGKKKPVWLEKFKCWEVPRSWFSPLVEQTLKKYGKLYIIQPYRIQEKCASACWNAEKHECQCSCMGAHHGAGTPDGRWFEVSDTFATTWREQELACRLLEAK
jgi:hypothetical protein